MPTLRRGMFIDRVHRCTGGGRCAVFDGGVGWFDSRRSIPIGRVGPRGASDHKGANDDHGGYRDYSHNSVCHRILLFAARIPIDGPLGVYGMSQALPPGLGYPGLQVPYRRERPAHSRSQPAYLVPLRLSYHLLTPACRAQRLLPRLTPMREGVP